MLAPGVFSLQATITIDGSALGPSFEPLLESVVVDDHLHLPSMFVIVLRDHTRTVLADAKLKIGSKVVIQGPAGDAASTTPLITGEVTSIEAEYDALGSRAVVRGYDPSHRLQRGRRTATYINVTDSDIARTVASRAGLDIGTIDGTNATHDHVAQANQSDWDFLQSRARRIGYHVAFQDGKFQFRRPVPASGAPSEGDFESKDPIQMVLGQDLHEFRPRLTSSEQVGEVGVRAWDQVHKKIMTTSKATATASAKLPTDPARLAGMFGSHELVETSQPFDTEASVEAATEALVERLGSAFAEADGVMRGTPALRAGTPFSVSVVGDEFLGGYVATSTRHVFDRDGYRTEFAVSGQQDRSLLGLAGGGPATGPGRVDGVLVAVVDNVEDPLQLGRVRLKLPTLSDDYVSDWARVVAAGAANQTGQVFLPDVGDEVLVAFELGDVNRPYVLGGLWSDPNRAPLGDGLFDNGHNKRQGIVSRKGHKLVFFDDDQKSGVAVMTTDKGLLIALDKTSTEIHVHADGTVLIDATRGVTIKSDQSITLEASQNLTLKGSAGVKIESSGVVDIDGSVIQLN